MMTAILAVFAVISGLVLGFWLRSTLARKEADQAALQLQAAAAEREQARTELAALRLQMERAQAELQALAGSARLAEERQSAAERLMAEREQARAELQTAAEAHGAEMKRASEAAQLQAAAISKLEAELKAERTKTPEVLAALEEAKQILANHFKALAGDVIKEERKNFADGSQKDLGTLLDPLKTQIAEFKKKVEEAQTDSKTGVAKLEGMIGGLSALNTRLAEEARNLTTALKGSSKAQGDWGEFILRDLLEKAGLREGEQYSFQESFGGEIGEDGTTESPRRTDVILNFPDGRHLVVDSKVSLNAYAASVDAASEEVKNGSLREHVKNMREHIGKLASSGYHSLPGKNTPDFVVMFVPIEPAFLVALQAEPGLWNEAFQKGVLLTGPTTFLFVIRIINTLWASERQEQKVREVWEKATSLYEKFVGFTNDMEALGNALAAANAKYASAKGKLCEGPGNLVKQVEDMRKLGVSRKLLKSAVGKKKKTRDIPLQFLQASGAQEENEEEEAAEESANLLDMPAKDEDEE